MNQKRESSKEIIIMKIGKISEIFIDLLREIITNREL